jgi:hypothetical protein
MGLMPVSFLKALNIIEATLGHYHTVGVRRTKAKCHLNLFFILSRPAGGLFEYLGPEILYQYYIELRPGVQHKKKM